MEITERTLLDALWDRLTRPVNGDTSRYVMAEQVRHHPGPYGGRSIADALAVDCWGSGNYELEGYEVKTTRSDWRRELEAGTVTAADGQTIMEPYAKSFPWRQHCTRWYILAPAGVVPMSELPATWGLIELSSDPLGAHRLRAVRPAGRLQTAPLGVQQIAGLMRAVAQTATHHARKAS